MLETILAKVGAAIVIVGFIALAWLVVCVMVRLFTFCFDLPFSLKIATGVWVACLLIRLTISGTLKVDGKHNH